MPNNAIKLTVLLCAIIVFLQTGCATIMSGTSQEVLISTEPSGATVVLNDMTMETPAKFTLKRSETYVAEISKPGYHTTQVKLEKSMNGWIFGNIVFGGIPGLVVDYISGGANNISPGDAHINLVSTTIDEPSMIIWDAQSLKEEAKKTSALTKE
ncbi:PEGA domain-containing protein [Planctomycetota bacterium]|nr:PEGA domain-containing protein [Planctomycetota bacterium]